MTCAHCGRPCPVATWPSNDEAGNVFRARDPLGRPVRYRIVPGTARLGYPGDVAEAYCSPECSLARHAA